MNATFSSKNSGISPKNNIKKSRNNKKSFYHDFIIEKRSLNYDISRKSKFNNNITLSPPKNFLSTNATKYDKKNNLSNNLITKTIDYTKKLNNKTNKTICSSTNMINSMKTQKFYMDYINKVYKKEYYSKNDNEAFDFSSSILPTKSDDLSSYGTLTKASNHQKTKSGSYVDVPFKSFLNTLFESKLKNFIVKIKEFDFFSLFECFLTIFQNLAKVDHTFTPLYDYYTNLIDFNNSKQNSINQKERKEREIEKLNKTIIELNDIYNKNIIELEKKDNEIKQMEKKFIEEIDLFKKRENKLLKILYLIETGGISLNQVININNNTSSIDLNDYKSKIFIDNNCNLDSTVYFPDKTPKIQHKLNKSKNLIPKLDFQNLPRYQSPISSKDSIANDDEEYTSEFNNKLECFSENILLDEGNLTHNNSKNIEYIMNSLSQSISNIKDTTNSEVNFDEKIKIIAKKLTKDEKLTQAERMNNFNSNTQIKKGNNVSLSINNINDIFIDKKSNDLKKFTHSKKLIESCKILKFNKLKSQYILKNNISNINIK